MPGRLVKVVVEDLLELGIWIPVRRMGVVKV